MNLHPSTIPLVAIMGGLAFVLFACVRAQWRRAGAKTPIPPSQETMTMTNEVETLRAQLAIVQSQRDALRAEKLTAELQRIRATVTLGSIIGHFTAVAIAVGDAALPALDEQISTSRHTLGSPPPSPFGPDFEIGPETRADARAAVADVIGHLTAIRSAVAGAYS